MRIFPDVSENSYYVSPFYLPLKYSLNVEVKSSDSWQNWISRNEILFISKLHMNVYIYCLMFHDKGHCFASDLSKTNYRW